MKRYQRLSMSFLVLAVLLSDVMCAVTAYDYCALQWCGRYAGCSAPAYAALFEMIPFGIGILICGVLAWFFHKKGVCGPAER